MALTPEQTVKLHEQLWAPWRLAYVADSGQSATKQPAAAERPLKLLPGGDADCFLCRAVADTADRENLVVDRDQHTVVVLNRYPYNNGHLLIAPRTHKGALGELSAEEQLECTGKLAEFVGRLEKLISAQGFNIGLNLGRVAGAGLPGHLHWHLVPRWAGDTNFMPVTAGVRVIPQSLEALWELLHAESH